VWGAISESGRPLAQGTHVKIVAVNGTKVIVQSTEPLPPAVHPDTPPSGPPSTPPPASPT
jgi:hypothetical protein